MKRQPKWEEKRHFGRKVKGMERVGNGAYASFLMNALIFLRALKIWASTVL